jgi:hypothetical protein
MSMNYVFNRKGRKVGWTTGNSEVTMAYGDKGQTLGFYKKNIDTTFDSRGAKYGSSDLTKALIMEAAPRD